MSLRTFFATLLSACTFALGQTTQPFDGRPWNISTGNLSVSYIQASPIGAHPRPNVLEPPPSVETMRRMKADGLVAYEDYIAWGAVEREPGKWDWTQHDAVMKAVNIQAAICIHKIASVGHNQVVLAQQPLIDF